MLHQQYKQNIKGQVIGGPMPGNWAFWSQPEIFFK